MNWKTLISDLIASGLTQAQIAERVGCSQATVSELMNGKTETPNFALGTALVALHKKAKRKQAA